MKTFTVRLNGNPVKNFTDEEEAKRFMVNLIEVQKVQNQVLAYVDEAVLKSDMKESKEILKHIMSL
jgi:hypothetical protein